MGYKYFNKNIVLAVLFGLITICLFSCTGEEKRNTSNTYYVELVNFNDSLNRLVSDKINGKVSYYRNNKLEIVSLNYLTEDYPDMHYFEKFNGPAGNLKSGSKKIRVEFVGDYCVDSINYSIQKYKYNNSRWEKISDMGFIKSYSTNIRLRPFALKEYIKQIINNVVSNTYN